MMAPTLIPHLNLSVSGPKHRAELFDKLSRWQMHRRGPSGLGGWTNLVGFVIDDLDDIERRANAFGLVWFNCEDCEPGCQLHCLDRHGIECEIVSFSKGAAA
jgi:hypothetical protein